jgi:hypothetical protein
MNRNLRQMGKIQAAVGQNVGGRWTETRQNVDENPLRVEQKILPARRPQKNQLTIGA